MNVLNILFLCNHPAKNAEASTVTDHIESFRLYSHHNVHILSFLRRLPENIDLDRFDAILLHYSIQLGYLGYHYLDQKSRLRIKNFRGLKAAFIQDEYRSVEDVLDSLVLMNIDLLFTCLPDYEVEKVYPRSRVPNLKTIHNLTGYVSERLLHQSVQTVKHRPIDVGYRTRPMPFWLGELGYEKWQIAHKFMKYSAGSGLTTDISYDESDRIYGQKWIAFISSCKSVLGVESGASVFDFTGKIKERVENYLSEYPNADFFDVQKKFLKPFEGKIYLNQISPRCFESAALKTVMVLYEGNYSGILVPDRHYITLKKDFSNFSEVLSKLKDDRYLQEMADRTYAEVAKNPKFHYRSLVKMIDKAIYEEMDIRHKTHTKSPYTHKTFLLDLMTSPSYLFYRCVALPMQRILLGTACRGLLYKVWSGAPSKFRHFIRPLLAIIGR